MDGPKAGAWRAPCRKGESDVVCRAGVWFLMGTSEVLPEAGLNGDPVDLPGIDLGVVDLAIAGDGEIMAGRK